MWGQMCLRQDVHRAEPSWGQLIAWASNPPCWRWHVLSPVRPCAAPRLALKGLYCPDFPPSLSSELWTNATSPRKEFL